MTKRIEDGVLMPAGKYWIGDLCYVLENEWDEVCRLIISGRDLLDGKFALSDGRVFASFSTAFGDGCYFDGKGNEYCVDSGCIGCIKTDGISLPANKYLGHTLIADSAFRCGYDNGVIYFGALRINTNMPDSDDWQTLLAEAMGS